MAKRQRQQGIPTELTVAQFEEFVLPHLTVSERDLCPHYHYTGHLVIY